MLVVGAAGGGAVSRRNCSIAATTAAASSGDAALWRISIRGRGGACLPFRAIAALGDRRRRVVRDTSLRPRDGPESRDAARGDRARTRRLRATRRGRVGDAG